MGIKCRTPRWVRGLKSKSENDYEQLGFVAPHDGCVDWNLLTVCILKLYPVAPHDGCVDWNIFVYLSFLQVHCRTPRWVRGLKSSVVAVAPVMFGRTPRWVRGLKYCWGARIRPKHKVAPHDGCVDWNNQKRLNIYKSKRRTPRWVRGLKLQCYHLIHQTYSVAPHDGCVDWNNRQKEVRRLSIVAPHDGCVDWNLNLKMIMNNLDCRTPRWVRGLK